MTSGITFLVDQLTGRSRIPESVRRHFTKAVPPPSVQYLLEYLSPTVARDVDELMRRMNRRGITYLTPLSNKP